jgi:hypothetical protein
MDWEFYKRGEAGDAYAASQSRIIIEGDHTISPLEIFVREVLQNSLDAALGDQKVGVHFRLRKINQPGPRDTFLKALGWSKLKERVAAANRVRKERNEPPEFGDPQQLERGSLYVLEIAERGTIGLVGLEAVRSEQDERRWPGEPPKAYIALARDDARREKQGLGSGGTYGLGKAVLWAASQIQAVAFFSRLSIPWKETTHRAAGQARLGPHFLNNEPFRGLGYGGDMHDGWCKPASNQAAQTLASQFGISARGDSSESGTTIVIPFWVQPEADVDELPTHALLARYAARYFWPAIIDDRLEVTTESVDDEADDAANYLDHYQPFIELYKRVKEGTRGARDSEPEKIRFTVPIGPPPRTDSAQQTFVLAAMTEVATDGEVREDFKRKVACIRGQGMVVGYAKLTGNTLVRPFVGLALGGRAGDASPQGLRGDVLLGFSEYVTHTKWDEKSASLRHWPSARPVIRELLKQIRDYFERNSKIEQPAGTTDLSPLEEGLRFPGVGRLGPPPPPPAGVPQLRLQRFERDENRYAFEIRSRIAARQKPFNIELWAEAALETGSASPEDRFTLENVRTVPSNLTITVLKNRKCRIEVPALGADTDVRVSGTTEQLPPELLAVSEGLLRASVVKEKETAEQPAFVAGDDPNA